VLQPEGRYERLIFWIVKNVPGRYVAVLAGLSYFGLGLGVPFLFRWDPIWWVNANIYGTLFAGSLILVWLLVQLQARDRRHLLDWTSDLRLLDGEEFEWLVGELYRREGWTVIERGRQDAPDGNVDLEIRRAGERRLVQCKRWTVLWVGVDEIRRFLGTLSADKLPPSAGAFVTLSRFTEQAVELAKKSGLEIVDNRDLFERVEKVRQTAPCQKCDSPMLLDCSRHGWWFRCVTEGCDGKRDLGSDPGRAVALITEQS
jgi:hypothetical protein